MVIEKWSPLEAFYMTIITISTVGFSEVNEMHTSGRILTSVLIVMGVVFGTYTIGTITSYFVGGTVMDIIRGTQVEKKIHKLQDHVIIAGYGKLGTYVAQSLHESHQQFVIIEMDDETH